MYYSRLIEKEIELKLRTSGAIVVAGPKFCGKTTTCMLYQKSFIKLNTKQAIAMARMNPKAVLPGENPRLIDEWQKAPDIWNQVKDDLDIKYEFGKYILTGSSTPADKTEVHHSGAGRIAPDEPVGVEGVQGNGFPEGFVRWRGFFPLGLEPGFPVGGCSSSYVPRRLADSRTGSEGHRHRDYEELLERALCVRRFGE